MGNALRISYEPGKFCQVRLSDGTKLLVRTSPRGVHVAKLGFFNLPMELLWQYTSSIPGRFDPASFKTVMDAVLRLVESCETLDEARRVLKEEAAQNEGDVFR